MKKEQVKGCGSVNRPTPGSQRPAEPVATGFLEGVKISKNRGQILGLGVKPWGVDAENSQCRAILYGVTIGVAAISCYQQGKHSVRLYAARTRRATPGTPRPPAGGVLKGKVKDATQKKGQKKERRVA